MKASRIVRSTRQGNAPGVSGGTGDLMRPDSDFAAVRRHGAAARERQPPLGQQHGVPGGVGLYDIFAAGQPGGAFRSRPVEQLLRCQRPL